MREGITITLAWRNVWRNKRRTILTLLTIFVGCAMIIFMNSMAKGGHDRMIDDAVEINTGHIQVHEKGYWDNRTLDYAFKNSPEIDEFLNDERIAGYAKRILSAGLLSFRGNTAGAMIQGIQPDKEKNVTNIYAKILPGGRYLTPGDNSVLLGETLARNLGAEVGSEIAMISQGFDGSIAAGKFNVAGLFRTGNSEYDNGLMLMSFRKADSTFSMMNYINSVVIRANEISGINSLLNDLSDRFKDPDTAYEVMGWDELMPELVQFIVMDDMGAYIFDFILYMVVAFGVLNTIQMAVFERTRETGIMLSIGTRPRQIFNMIILESILISLLGIVSGIILGSALGWYFHFNPIDYTAYSKEAEVWGISSTILPATVTTLNILVTAFMTFFLSLLFTIFPARRASKLKPIEAIRHL